MYEMSHKKVVALSVVSEIAGKWLETLGKTDLAQMTPDEWMAFLKTVCDEYDNMMDNLNDTERRINEYGVPRWRAPYVDRNDLAAALREARKGDGATWDGPSRYNTLSVDFNDEIPF
jgi:hypothetical protein